jgi:hypothetical protein
MAEQQEVPQIISKMYDFPGLNVNREKHMVYEKGKINTYPILHPTALVGIEIEVENIRDMVPVDFYWQYKEDGSLRNHGAEFASIPLRGRQVEFALDYLNTQMHMFNEPDFSNRTSVHVHLNVRDMTWDQIKVFTILYAMYERHFFHQAGTKRESSIFCVPLYKTHQLRHFMDNPDGSASQWHKYSAVNLGTIIGSESCSKFGTIEFRHMYGTLDTKLLISWINQILCLRQEMINTTLPDLLDKLKRTNTTSEYIVDYRRIFREYALPYSIMEQADFESCITATKRAVFSRDLYKYNTCLRPSVLFTYQDQKNTKPKLDKEKLITAWENAKVKAQLQPHNAGQWFVGNIGMPNLEDVQLQPAVPTEF